MSLPKDTLKALEWKRKQRESHLGRKGYKHTEETKKKISIAAKGHKTTEETKRKISSSLMGNICRKGKGKYKDKAEWDRIRNFRRRGTDENKYNELLLKQNYVCAICLKAETRKHQNGKIARLSIDHCHKTGKIRGLLCGKCNFAIGQFNDNPYLCERATNYLLTK